MPCNRKKEPKLQACVVQKAIERVSGCWSAYSSHVIHFSLPQLCARITTMLHMDYSCVVPICTLVYTTCARTHRSKLGEPSIAKMAIYNQNPLTHVVDVPSAASPIGYSNAACKSFSNDMKLYTSSLSPHSSFKSPDRELQSPGFGVTASSGLLLLFSCLAVIKTCYICYQLGQADILIPYTHMISL